MTTLADLQRELGLESINEAKRIARHLDIPIGADETKPLRSKQAKAIRAEVARRSAEVPDVAPPDDEHPTDEAVLVKPPPRKQPGRVRGDGFRVFLHGDFVDWLAADRVAQRFKDKAHFVLRHLLADGRTPKVKGLRGPGQGWKRSPLGGSGGNQWYLWWLAPGSTQGDALSLERDERFVRLVLHHDDNNAVPDEGARADYIALDPSEFVNSPEFYGTGFSDEQVTVVRHSAPVRMIKGHPGSGKTTTLLATVCQLSARKVLYLTYSDRLVSQAKSWFNSFGPVGLAVEVLSVRDLMALWPGHPEGIRDPEAAAAQLGVALADYRGGLGPWEGRVAELYGEIHASVFGRALPFPFRGRPAAPNVRLSPTDYDQLRKRELGPKATSAVRRAVDQLSEADLHRLFPAPLQARTVLERLLAGDALPTRLADIDWIVVDEVQDLTLVELSTLIEIARRSGDAEGSRAGLIAAGDEGQTVRPTDFCWGPLNDLCAERLAPRHVFELAGNVRCPPNLAKVINDSWQFYRLFDRQVRPRGRAEADLDGASEGRVVRVVAEQAEDLRPLLDFFATNPDSEVVYPGFAVPPEYRALVDEDAVWTSRSIKGLDFRTVAVLDVGKRLGEVATLAAKDGKGHKGGAFAKQLCRNLVDQLRVAISRSTDTLLVVDVRPDDASVGLVADLLANVASSVLHADPEEARLWLEKETMDPLDRVQRFAEDILAMVDDQPTRALQRARIAVTILDEMRAANEHVPKDLVADLAELEAKAALLHARDLREQDRQGEIASVLATAEGALRARKAPTAARVVRELGALLTGPKADAGSFAKPVLNAGRALVRVEGEAPRVAPVLTRILLDWAGRVANEAPIPENPAARTELAERLLELGQLLEQHSDVIATQTQELSRRTAQHLLQRGDHKGALEWFQSLRERDRASEGVCFEALRQLDAAAQAFEDGSAFEDALRCARSIPDWDTANRLANSRGLGSDADRWSLQWANRLRRVLEERPTDSDVARLTEAERSALRGLLKKHPAVGAGERRHQR